MYNQGRKYKFLFHWLLFFCFMCHPGWSHEYDHVRIDGDGIPSEFVTDGQTLVIADTHGNVNVMLEVLTKQGILNDKGEWINTKDHVVLLGNFVGEGRDSISNLHLVAKLRELAQSAGGHLHVLYGNHEIDPLMGKHNLLRNAADRMDYTRDEVEWNKLLFGMLSHPQYPVARSLASSSLVVKINKTLFVHAGLELRHSNWTLDELNATMRHLVRIGQERLAAGDLTGNYITTHIHS